MCARVIAVATAMLAGSTAVYALPRDAHGWTLFTPSADTRIIYVSSSAGNDATAQWYAPGSGVIGSDPFNPTGAVLAYATVSNALKVARHCYPDWLLLKRGDAFYERFERRNGRSEAARFLYSAYGSADTRPVLKVGAGSALSTIESIEYAALAGLDFYAHTRDPQSPEYTGAAGSSLISINNTHYRGSNIVAVLIEDCRFRFGQSNFTLQRLQKQYRVSDIVVRRNVFVDAYSTNSHAQGIYALDIAMVLEENVFDHNGWLIQGTGNNAQELGAATMFNHNTYFTTCNNVCFASNIFLRASSIGNKWTGDGGTRSSTNLVMVDNLYVDGEIGISLGGNSSGARRFADIGIVSNVFYAVGQSQPTGRTLAWNIEAKEWDGGEISGNLVMYQTNAAVDNCYGIAFTGGGSRNVRIHGNVLHGLLNCTGLQVTDTAANYNIVYDSNQVHFPGLSSRITRTYSPLYAISFKDSVYYTGRATTAWFNVNGTDRGFSAWQSAVNERSAVAHNMVYPDAQRTLESYMRSIGETGTYAAFIAAVRGQSKMTWRTELTAPVINEYFRGGFRALRVATTGLPVAVAGVPYQASLDAVHASGTVSWTLYHGTLPAGLALSSNGVISGVPAGWGSNVVTLLAHDAVNVIPKTLLVTVIPEPALGLLTGLLVLLRTRR